MSQSPRKPWVVGRTPTYTSFRLQVNVCQDGDGNVWSDHGFMEPVDEMISQTLRHGGVQQIAHSLLTEAVRREAFLTTLILISQGKGGVLPSEEQVTEAVEKVLTATIKKMAPGAAAGVLEMMREQLEGSDSTP